ncbi:MAG: polysaccharide deacetylase family protein [Rhodospirillales bacterium]|jgi:peptidoglycan/xylan/chitin deacetylase (PgdA/CDA1 family)|nr:polysaccharide deacetylase [Rhodospirillaceae bacterium]MDP6429243.1 polysaccharide deacetylase family protein [Rhodospirillales bacterium]MDP6644547.1 polysaccharide deacetylase family protein [Rhodospirillales bacterium]
MQPQRYGPFAYTPINDRPKITWPNGARLALWIVPNVEFFPLNEAIPLRGGSPPVPDIPNWSQRDYGARVGIFRIMEVLSRHGIRGTVTLNSEVCDAYPQIVEEIMRLDWEIMGHNQSNSRILNAIPAEAEKDVIFDALERIEAFTGKRPKGWLGAGLIETWKTLDYLADAGITYVADWVNDDQPYLMDIGGRQMVSIPYSREINDIPQFEVHSRTPEEFDQMIRRQFDILYREGEESGRVMAICIHPFLIGLPHRIGCLDTALEYITGHDGVWCATGSEIIDHYLVAGATF